MESVQIPCIGYDIEADFYQGEKNEVLLVLPGYTSSKLSYGSLVKSLVEKTGMSALVVDYTGHGSSPFNIMDVASAQNFSEVVTAFDWLINEKGYVVQNINVMGTSYGGFHATHLASYRQFNKLILRVPAIYSKKDFHTKHGNIEDTHRREYRYDASNFDDHWLFRDLLFDGNSYVLTHSLDDVCPIVSTNAFVSGLNAIDTWSAQGFRHGLGESEYTSEQLEEYKEEIAGWLNS